MEHLRKDTIDMVKTPVTFMELGEAAQGTIEIKTSQQERLEEFTQRVGSGEFHVAIEGRIPCRCIDGRGAALFPNAAGGTESLMVADDLIGKQFGVNDGTTRGAYANLLQFMKKLDYDVGGHDADHKAEHGSGCGANDELETIYGVIVSKGDIIRQLAAQIGVELDDDTHDLIVKNASVRSSFSHGKELLDELKSTAGASSVDNLTGKHHEVMAIINTRFGTTLDREAVKSEFGNDYQAFNVDVWAFEEAAKIISLSVAEQQKIIAALAYYNLATALTLCGPNMRVAVL